MLFNSCEPKALRYDFCAKQCLGNKRGEGGFNLGQVSIGEKGGELKLLFIGWVYPYYLISFNILGLSLLGLEFMSSNKS